MVAYATKGKAAAITAPVSKSMVLYNAQAYNNSGGAINVGICQRFNYPKWQFYTYDFTTTTFTNASVAINAGTAQSIFTATNSDGYGVGSATPFNLVGLTVSTAHAGGVFTYKYWNGAAWTTLTTLEVPVYTAAADIWVVFQAPADWAVGGSGTNLNAAHYNILIQASTSPGGVVAVNAVWVAQFLEFYQSVADKSAVQINISDTKPYFMDGGDSLIPYFATAHAANAVSAFYSFGE